MDDKGKEFEIIGDILPRVLSRYKPISYAGINFQSISAIRNRIKSILGNIASSKNRYHIGVDIPGVDGEFLIWGARKYACEYLPEVESEDIEAVQICWVKSNDRYPNSKPHRGFKIRLRNGNKIDIGKEWLLPRTSSSESEALKSVREAARVAISKYIIEFKEKTFNGMECIKSQFPDSNEIVSSHSCHVDHYDLTFKEALKLFLSNKGISEHDVELKWDGDYAGSPARFANPELEREWIAYHNRHCKLRIISIKENLSLARGG